MNRVVVVIVALLIAAGLYYKFGYQPAPTAPALTEEASKPVEDAAKAATEATQDAAKTVTDAASTAVDATKDAAATAVDATKDAAAATAGAATEAATEAATAAGQAASDAAAAAGAAATTAATAATDAAAMVWDATKLSGQDILDRINAASIPQATKDTLLATYNQVKDNPSAVQTLLDQLKQAMGL